MQFKEYQEIAKTTAMYPTEMKLLYPTLGLSGEVGEVSEKVKKLIRDKEHLYTIIKYNELRNLTPENVDDLLLFITGIKKELGDVLWYISAIASDLGLSLDDIANTNVEKLKSRKERNVIQGSGDNR